MFPSQKYSSSRNDKEYTLCFNGAGMFPSQKYPQIYLDNEEFRASMGPGCFHPRNLLEIGQVRLNSRASMGPGCFHPRNAVLRMGTRGANAGFNGAGMFPSQKSANSVTGYVRGRASMGPGCFHPRNDRARRRATRWTRASMGPGCFHPRNRLGAPEWNRAISLQWGRDISIPEIWPGRSFPNSH